MPYTHIELFEPQEHAAILYGQLRYNSTTITCFAIRSNVTKEACAVNPGRIGITVNSGHFSVYSHYPKGKAPHNQDYRNLNSIHAHSQ